MGRCWPCLTSAYPINALLTMTLGVGMTLYESQRLRLDAVTLELRTRELEHERARKMALEARLASLESRLQPHFLFNTLNAISALIQEDPDQRRAHGGAAGRAAALLARRQRAGAGAAGRRAEDRRRLPGDRADAAGGAPGVTASTCRPELARRARCRRSSIQTLVENSVKHAVAPRPSGGRIRVTAPPPTATGRARRVGRRPRLHRAALRPGHGLENLQAPAAGALRRRGDADDRRARRRHPGDRLAAAVGRVRDAAAASAPSSSTTSRWRSRGWPGCWRRPAAWRSWAARPTPPEGWSRSRAQPIDVLFLDIHMPGLSGFEVVERVPPGPAVVFTTAHDQHAVQAFEVNAVDYLLKPIEAARLDRALDRIAGRRDDGGADVRATLERLARHLRGGDVPRPPGLAPPRPRPPGRRRGGDPRLARDRAHLRGDGGHRARARHDDRRAGAPARSRRASSASTAACSSTSPGSIELRADEDGHLQVCLKDTRRTELAVARDRVRPLKERLGVV